MKNTLEIQDIAGRVKTVFYFIDGSEIMELHRQGVSDSDVLVKILKKKFYQHYKGEWQITLPREHRVFEEQDFEKAVQMTLRYMHDRDNPNDYDGFY